MENIKYHEIANIFPLIHGKEFVDLKADIKANGVHEPIVIYNGQILDGRNRFRACQEVGVTPEFTEYQGNDPVGYVVSLNLHRRHMNETQRSAVGASIANLSVGKPNSANWRNNNTQAQAAERLNVSERSVNRAKKVQQEGVPELFEAIQGGTVSVSAAADVATLPTGEQQAIVAKGEKEILQAAKEIRAEKYRAKEAKRESKREENRQKIVGSLDPEKLTGVYSTIVIDPPWDWGDEGDQDQLGRARPDYGTMSFNDLLDLPVGNLADDNAHIYMWITNRSLPKGFDLFERWGFRYITALTWVKPHFGMGNYFRGQTEHVLFGVKGSLPLSRKNQGTVFNAPRGQNGHSSKPVEFYPLVESCSPGPYLEMFSRVDRKDWTHWGENSNAA